ncbi:nucleoside 2-deoxyribosyltransferase [bacterium]|nr:nucleoside 2-deoxyribosyltransferase [bacterium]|tara:strand:+ start:502 stop:885 length:384 start_codon:yes stop_codon:yes gene_type:complete
MKIYLAIKFHEDFSNRELIDQISSVLVSSGNEVTVLARDYEKWGEVKFSPDELMKLTFKITEESDLLLVEFSEKGVGLGIEAGYAHAKSVPIIVIAKTGSDISSTMQGIAKRVIFYNDPSELSVINL